jgi:hypothetical protein
LLQGHPCGAVIGVKEVLYKLLLIFEKVLEVCRRNLKRLSVVLVGSALSLGLIDKDLQYVKKSDWVEILWRLV